MSILNEIKASFRENDVFVKIIYVNVAVFVLLRLGDVAGLFSSSFYPGWLLDYFAMPIGAHLIVRPWTLLTSVFAHYDLIHFLFNMLALYWFGRIFMLIVGSEERALVAYVAGGVAGALASFLMLLFAWAPEHGVLIGASGAIMSILLAATVSAPDRRIWVTFFGDVKLKYIAIVYVFIDVIMLLGNAGNAGGHLAHLGGAVAGVVLANMWRGRAPRSGILAWLESLFSHKPKMSVLRGSGNVDWDYNQKRADNSREVDRILEKIKARGYNSLSDEEKKILFDQSKKL